MSPKQLLQSQIRTGIKAAFDLDITEVEISRAQADLGDYATNIAFKLAPELKLAPREVAERIAESLKSPELESALVAGPGFINLRLHSEYWRTFLAEIEEDFVQSNRGKGQKVQLEYISANPTGPLTLGNARGGFIGDVLARVLRACGYEVTREYYFNDAGTQIRHLVQSYEAHRRGEVDDETPYKGEYMQEMSDDASLLEKTTGQDGEELGRILTEHIFETYIKQALSKANIEFDEFTNERVIKEHFPVIRQELEKRGLVEEREGALWLKSSTYGDERDRVLIKSSGDHTYLANDIAYHHDIFSSRKFDTAIKIWGADHAGQVPSLKLTLNQLFPEKKIDFIIVQWVRLIKDGKEFKISKRAGTYVTVEELVERVGTDVARWFMLMRSNDTHMDFDLDLATDESQRNPFWYVMYAYVRLKSIQREASSRGLKPAKALAPLSEVEQHIVRQIAELPELVNVISSTHEVHKLTFYGQELARLFHEWYEAERVLTMPEAEAAAKLHFLSKLERVFRTYFALMNVEPKERM